MSANPPFPILNPGIPVEGPTFHPFSRFPKELRLLVWRHAIRRQRIIKVDLSSPWLADPTTFKERVGDAFRGNSKGLAEIGSKYLVTLHGHQILSKYFRVCQDSRREASLFYRVRIPCRFVRWLEKDPLDTMTVLINAMSREAGNGNPACTSEWPSLKDFIVPNTLYLNPEWDFLALSAWPCSYSGPLVGQFLHDLKTQYDPRGIGLLNLVLKRTSWGIRELDPVHLPPHVTKSVKHTLRQLHEVFIAETPRIGRINLEVFGGCISFEMWFNRSFPIATQVPAFERLTRDSRPISQDLKYQYIGAHTFNDPNHSYHRYTVLLSQFSILPSETTTQMQLMLANDMLHEDIYDRDDAQAALKKDYERWWADPSKWPKRAEKAKFEAQEYVMDVLPAFGFWLFPLEAMKMTANESDKLDRYVVDMSMFTPELGVSVMHGS